MDEVTEVDPKTCRMFSGTGIDRAAALAVAAMALGGASDGSPSIALDMARALKVKTYRTEIKCRTCRKPTVTTDPEIDQCYKCRTRTDQ